MDYKLERIEKLSIKLEGQVDLMDPEQAGEYRYELSLQRKAVHEIQAIIKQSEYAYEFAKLESRWNRYMKDNNIVDQDARLEFLNTV